MTQLKQYQREILRARSRVEVAELDQAIDDLILDLIGRLTKREHKRYQATRLTRLIGATPEFIVARRGFALGLTESQIALLTAPDVLTMEEMTELVTIMQAIADWLRACQSAGEQDLTFADLCRYADEQAVLTRETFVATYHRLPKVTDLPESVMRLPRARSIVKLVRKAGALLPPENGVSNNE